MKFFDTNALLDLQEEVFEEKFLCSIKSFEELEHIKTSKNKDEETRYKARKITHLLDERSNMYEAVIIDYKQYTDDILNKFGLNPEDPDNIIMYSAWCKSKEIKDLVFVTNDICCKNIAKNIFGLNVESGNDYIDEDYKGFTEVSLTEEQMAYFYSNLNENMFNLHINEYLILKNHNDVIVDKFVWDGNTHEYIKFGQIKSTYFGNIKPYNGDIYQQLALDSLSNNKITMLKGKSGSGKSYLALGWLFYLLEKHKIDKIIVFCNTIATMNSAKLGYYPGSKDMKLLDSSIGNMLGAKLGGVFMVEQLIQENKLILLPMSDIRGYDTTGMNAGVYITEAQNMDITLMKLALQRIGEDSVCSIIDGDYTTQVDMNQYAGRNNGMRRMSEVFRGHDFYGEVELQHIFRSKIAEIADMM